MTQEPKILVIGEAMADVYHCGTVERLSPEAPIPVVKVSHTIVRDGGAANVAAALQALGAIVSVCYSSEAPTKNRLLVGDQQLARWDYEPYGAGTFDTALLERQLGESWDAVVVSDYGKGAFTSEVKALIRDKTTKSLFIDSKSTFEWPLDAWFFPNHKEYLAAATFYNFCRQVVHKMGEAGMELLDKGTRVEFEPARALQVRSVVGAGDTVIAAFAYAIACHSSPATALAFAADCAAEVVAKPYTAVPDGKEA